MSDIALANYEEITEAKVVEFLDSAGITNTLLPNEKKMFINIAREFRLNPFKREIHITAYGKGEYRKCSIITGYEVYIKRAERTGKLDGWSVRYEGEGKTLKAIVEIHRKDQKYPFSHEVYYSECCQYNREGQPNAVWAKMPRFMTKKVAIGQAFRLCFPDDLGGMPYEEAEIVSEQEPRDVTPPTAEATPKQDAPPPQHIDRLDERRDIIAGISQVMKALDTNNKPLFTEQEKIKERKFINPTHSTDELKIRLSDLLAELEKRQHAFDDDIPWEKEQELPDIF